jgi:hypothetical protein
MSAIDTLAVMSARYAHHRNTGASMVVIRSIKCYWEEMIDSGKKQVLKESNEAAYNKDEWLQFRVDMENL